MKDFKKVIKEALTPHYLRESVNEDFTHSSLAITDQSQILGLDDSELLDLLNKVSYEYTPELKDSARIISQEIEDRDLTNRIHYVDNERYEFMESVNEATRQELGMTSSVSKNRAKAALKNPSNDGSKVYGLDKDGKRVELKSINDIDKFKKFEIDADLNEDRKAKEYIQSIEDPEEREAERKRMFGDDELNEDIVDDKAKIYWLQKLKSGEIDTLPDNPRMEYLRHAMRDQLAQDKEQLNRERGLVKEASYDEVAMREYGAPYDELSEREKEWVRDKIDMDRGVMEEDNEMTPEEEHEHVKNLLKRNFMDEAEARVDEIDMNDPALMKARAAQMAAEKEKARQADLKQKEDFKKTYLNKKYGSSFMDKLEAEIGLKSELQDLKDEREMLMIDMEQEAEPEGGEIADRYGSRLNKIDARMELIKKDIDDLRMYESVNENEAPVKVGDKLKMAYQGSTVRDKTGVVTSVSDDMAQVDFGGGDSYGILFSRIKGNEIIKEDRFKKNKDSYIRVTEPRFRKDPTNPNFLFGYINYDTGPGVSIALGKETMAGQIRRLSSAEAVRQMEDIAKDLEYNYNLEDIDVTDLENGVVELFAVSDDFIDMDVKSELSTAMLNENMGEWPKELTSRYSDEYRFELEKVSPTYQDKPGRAKYRVIDIESGELKGTPVFEKPESLMAYADDLIKPQGGTQSSHFGTNEGTCGYGEDGKIGKKPAGPVDEIFPMGSSSSRDIKNKAARQRSSNKTANYHDLLKYYQFGIARIPRHKREKAGIPQAMHDRYGQEVWDILKKAYPNKGLSDTPPSDWRDSADELIMALGDEGNFEKTIKNPFYDIYAKLGPTDSHKKQLGIEEESDTDVGGGAKQAIGLDIDDEGASDAALDSEVNKMGYAESKEFNFKKMIKEALTPNYLK